MCEGWVTAQPANVIIHVQHVLLVQAVQSSHQIIVLKDGLLDRVTTVCQQEQTVVIGIYCCDAGSQSEDEDEGDETVEGDTSDTDLDDEESSTQLARKSPSESSQKPSKKSTPMRHGLTWDISDCLLVVSSNPKTIAYYNQKKGVMRWSKLAKHMHTTPELQGKTKWEGEKGEGGTEAHGPRKEGSNCMGHRTGKKTADDDVPARKTRMTISTSTN